MSLENKKKLVKEAAEQSLEYFINIVHPQRVLGGVHRDLINWWTREDAKSHQLVLLPRDHGKSAMIAYRVAWEITKNPAIRIMYVSSTSGLATKQVKAIGDILTSDKYRFYWPEMVNEDKSQREKWTEGEFSVDHPKRKQEAIRDSTIFAAGLTTTITGLHCDIAVLDDVVIFENAYTEEGRSKVERQYSLLASIEGADAKEWIVGTRYHPNDLYGSISAKTVPFFNDIGEVTGDEFLFEVFERQVESVGDGSGEYLWPRQQRSDGKWFGFDRKILEIKRAQYLDATQFRAQYYNDPNDLSGAAIGRDNFQYYEQKHLRYSDGKLYFKDRKLNVFAAVDFAYVVSKKADYTCIVVVGMDSENNYYVLEVDRFKSGKISEYYEHILRLHTKWNFRKLRAEVVGAQKTIVNDLKQNYIRPNGLALSVEEYVPTRHIGTKQERISAILQPKYNNRQMWHYIGGDCQTLEEELILQNPPHDDVKDALASAVEIALPPSANLFKPSARMKYYPTVSNRFGGI